MKRNCLKEICDGSGMITHKDGSMLRCPCGRIKRANDIYKHSKAPKQYQTFIEDLPFNPYVQNTRKLQILEQKRATNDISNEQFEQAMIKTYAPIKDVLFQFDDGKNNRPIKRFIEQDYKLYFYGQPGTMKTGASISLAYEGGKRNKSFLYLTMSDMHELFRYDFSDKEKEKENKEKIEKMLNVDVLIIDDLGRELDGINYNNESDVTLLKKICKRLDEALRIRNRLTILSSNLSIEDAKEKYSKIDARLTSKLFDGNVLPYYFQEQVRKQIKDDLIDDLL